MLGVIGHSSHSHACAVSYNLIPSNLPFFSALITAPPFRSLSCLTEYGSYFPLPSSVPFLLHASTRLLCLYFPSKSSFAFLPLFIPAQMPPSLAWILWLFNPLALSHSNPPSTYQLKNINSLFKLFAALLYIKEHYLKNEEATHVMGENICKSYI